MNITRKAPTPIRSAPSSAPLEAMVTKQQAHIDELVMRNRTTEQTIQKLKAEIEAEKQRHESSLQQLKQQFGQERTEWKEAADSLQNLWRAAYLRAVHDLAKERMEIVKLREELRLSRLAKLQRDYQIGMFQAKELELENHVVDLQDQLANAQWTYEQEHSKRTALKVQNQEILDELEELRSERDQFEVSLNMLFPTSTSWNQKCFPTEISCGFTFRTYGTPCIFWHKFCIVGACKPPNRRSEVEPGKATRQTQRARAHQRRPPAPAREMEKLGQAGERGRRRPAEAEDRAGS